MGVLVRHDLARLMAIASGAYVVWAGIWGCLYRKFFWDMVGATLGPAGLIPPPSADFFVKVIVDVPVIQIFNIINGVFTLALEYPLPLLVTAVPGLHRSFVFRAVFYGVWCPLFAILTYQTFNAFLFYMISAAIYVEAIKKGERMASGNKAQQEMV